MSQKISTGLAITLLILVPAVLILGYLTFAYNSLVSAEEEVFTAWSQVESTYQRRTDLVPNLVKTVQAFADQEMKAIAVVTDARRRALKELIGSSIQAERAMQEAQNSMKAAREKLNDETALAQIVGKQDMAKQSLSTLILMAENYPTLRSSDNFLMLQDQLEGTENRINTARMAFNQKAGDFNARIRKIPGSLLAGLGSFTRKAYFKADKGAEKAVSVEFSKPE